jgi:uncharacterized membrane protein YedE/YeeE
MSTTIHGSKPVKIIREDNADFEVRSLDSMCINMDRKEHPRWHLLKYGLAGMAFGIILVKAEVMSWFRIQEMFRFQSFHMYGVIGSAVVTGALGVWLIRKFGIKTVYGEAILHTPRSFNKGQVIGGLIFGFGWAMTGACPGPIYAIIGSGASVFLVVLLSAVAGTWVYGRFRERLPH